MFLIVFAAVVFLPFILMASFYFPSKDVLRITGTEVVRVDADGKRIQGDGRGRETRDVFYIYAEDIESKKPHVFENEDTSWGFPFYFKFNSTDVQATANSIAGERGTAIISSYGWRIPLVSWFPNATSVTRAAADASPFPWFNTVFLLILAGVLVALWRATRRFRKPTV
ncbi:DUF1523 family protein [Chenggangzhangella methanolivorans]|uniref:DUF1523 family protein n=2 Tax=Chenggangzhangella methanolivorans TaxID=1437009 RepID=A0A9E6URG2_9HYPH|nr:DUF1523 family protein [Chenggangzhangella methanolivorans]